jgi:predicted phosphodiesterase
MTYQLISDTHLEFHPKFQTNILPTLKTDTEYLILAGDICEARNFDRFSWFFEWCSQNYNKVFYVLGNHEHYHSNKHTLLKKQDSLSRTVQCARLVPNLLFFEMLREHNLNNIYLMSSFEPFQVDEDTIILGDTTWTDYDNGNPLCMLNCDRMMNDKRATNQSSQSRYDTHCKVINELKQRVSESTDKKIILVTHHPITRQCEGEQYKGSPINGGFYSDYDNWIIANPQIKAICSGHMHDQFIQLIGQTQYLINPFGYGVQSMGYNNLIFTI